MSTRFNRFARWRKTRAWTSCKLKFINDNGRCKWHGGFS
ncbi:MAG: HGGxSTG domain-containing protein, partial [Methylosarcina sp.]